MERRLNVEGRGRAEHLKATHGSTGCRNGWAFGARKGREGRRATRPPTQGKHTLSKGQHNATWDLGKPPTKIRGAPMCKSFEELKLVTPCPTAPAPQTARPPMMEPPRPEIHWQPTPRHTAQPPPLIPATTTTTPRHSVVPHERWPAATRTRPARRIHPKILPQGERR